MDKKFEKEFLIGYNSLIEPKEDEPISCAYLLDLFSEYSKDFHALAEIEYAYNMASKLHANQFRDSNEPYITHPLAVAVILAKMHADKNTIIAGLLHDAREDTGTSISNIGQLFNATVALYVDGVSKIEENDNELLKLDNDAYMRKLITCMGEDLEVMLIKLADKLHNMRTLKYKSREKQIKTAEETLNLFVPFAERLGVYQVKNELEDLSFKYIDPRCYRLIKEALYEILAKRVYEVKKTVTDINAWLNVLDIQPTFKYSSKNIYGIYKAIKDDIPDNYDLDTISNLIEKSQIHDLISVQIILEDTKQCYEANQVISSYYKVNTAESKDYIKNHKANLYKSLHTTIYDESGKMIQIQLRTDSMDKIANNGYAAIWDLSGPAFSKTDMKKAIKRNISKPVHAIDRIYENNAEFLAHIKEELLGEGHITVYTPKDEPMELPQGATVIDFAYKIHSDIGNSLDYAVINGKKMSNIYYQLHDGDTIELFTSPFAQPNVVWLEHIVTNRAYKKISEFVKIKESNQNSNINDESHKVLTKEFKKM